MCSPLPQFFSKSLFIIQFWWNFIWNIFIWLLVENQDIIISFHKWAPHPLTLPPIINVEIFISYIILMQFCMNHLCMNFNRRKWKIENSPLPLTSLEILKYSFIVQFRWNFVWNIFCWKLRQNYKNRIRGCQSLLHKF